MFATFSDYHIDVPEQLRDPGEFDWSMFYTRISVPWMFVVVEQFGVDLDGDELGISSNFFLRDCGQLIGLKQPGVCVKEVYLVSPGFINGTERWKMELVAEIWRLSKMEELEPSDPVQALFITESGQKISSTLGEEELDDCVERIYPFPKEANINSNPTK